MTKILQRNEAAASGMPRLAVSRVDKTTRPMRMEIYFPAPETATHQKQIHQYLTSVGKPVPNIQYILVPEDVCEFCPRLKSEDMIRQRLEIVDLTFAILPNERQEEEDDAFEYQLLPNELSEEDDWFLRDLCDQGRLVSYTLEDLTQLRNWQASSFMHFDDLKRFLKLVSLSE